MAVYKESDKPTNRLTIIDNPTEDQVSFIQKNLQAYNWEQTNGEIDNPGIEINLALKDTEGKVIGGLNASTMIRVMHLEVLWVADEYRKHGYGRDLVLEAERIGSQKGCLTSQTWSFSFQAPDFYRKIGYEVLGIYDGYPDGITESVLRKRLEPPVQTVPRSNWTNSDRNSSRFSIDDNPTDEEMKIVNAGLGNYVKAHTARYKPGIKILLIVKDKKDNLIGGLLAFTAIRNMVVEHLWLEEHYRGRGLGRKLLFEAERIAKENNCIASQTWCLSFQAPEFFTKLGYDVFGVSDGYPDPIQEYYFIKKYN